MIDEKDVLKLLDLHSKAYSYLMFLADKSKQDPEILSTQVVEELKKKKSCESWLSKNINSIPENIRPHKDDLSSFAGIFSSFFVTSFKVDNLIFESCSLM